MFLDRSLGGAATVDEVEPQGDRPPVEGRHGIHQIHDPHVLTAAQEEEVRQDDQRTGEGHAQAEPAQRLDSTSRVRVLFHALGTFGPIGDVIGHLGTRAVRRTVARPACDPAGDAVRVHGRSYGRQQAPGLGAVGSTGARPETCRVDRRTALRTAPIADGADSRVGRSSLPGPGASEVPGRPHGEADDGHLAYGPDRDGEQRQIGGCDAESSPLRAAAVTAVSARA